MAGRLEIIERLITDSLGHAFLSKNPDLPYAVNRILVGIGNPIPSFALFWDQIDSLLFNSVYTCTNQSMTVLLDSGHQKLITGDEISELADRIVSLLYTDQPPTPELESQLYDLSRSGSFYAMRELLTKYNPPENEREMIRRVLKENGQL